MKAKRKLPLLAPLRLTGKFDTDAFEVECKFTRLEGADLQAPTNVSVSLKNLIFFKEDRYKS